MNFIKGTNSRIFRFLFSLIKSTKRVTKKCRVSPKSCVTRLRCQIVALFFLIKVKQRGVLNTLIIQKTVSKHHLLCERRKNFTVEYMSIDIYFSLNVLQFELQYEGTPPQIFFCGYRLYNYYVTMQKQPIISSVVKNSWN